MNYIGIYITLFCIFILDLSVYEYIEYKIAKKESKRGKMSVTDYTRIMLDYSDEDYKYDLWSSV